ncbi:hypothetical protein ACJVQT_23065 [Enterobacter huaxiensis]|uniref:hypothetical protein n=1 Tax=Enterobacter huaxiensis TaxID=2494702 RepID=UPI002175B558|nr:hypothetical protein [Enterobacter huaxiensis]MCS5452548.1 hypothetical protein [Enterobacter huaxiensis]
MEELQVVMKIAIVTDENGEQKETDLILAALPLKLSERGYYSKSMEVLTAPDLPNQLYHILSNTIPRLAKYVTEITKNPAGNDDDIRQVIFNEGGMAEALATIMQKSRKLDS